MRGVQNKIVRPETKCVMLVLSDVRNDYESIPFSQKHRRKKIFLRLLKSKPLFFCGLKFKISYTAKKKNSVQNRQVQKEKPPKTNYLPL